MPTTLQDIADRLGISASTVSRALAEYPDIAISTRQRVLETAEEMGYRPNVIARMLQKQRTDTIGFIIPTHGPPFSDPFFSEILTAIGNQAAEQRYDLLVSTRAPGAEEMVVYKRMVQERRVDGLLVVRTRRQDHRIAYLVEEQFPVVAFGKSDLEVEFPYLDVDSKSGVRRLTQHLIDLGHRRIACISAPLDLIFASARLEGYREALQANSIAIDESLVIVGALTERSGYGAGRELLTRDNAPTAIVACNDLMATGVMSAAQGLGLTVGRDLAVTGFDDVPLAEHSHPSLTTVRQPVYEIGQRICEMLIHLLRGETLKERHVILEPQLVVRDSCGALIQ